MVYHIIICLIPLYINRMENISTNSSILKYLTPTTINNNKKMTMRLVGIDFFLDIIYI